MIVNTLSDLLVYINGQGLFVAYLILFILKCIEGPIVIYLASFAASLGYFNIYIIFTLGALSGIIPDTLLYVIGHSLRSKFIFKLLHRFGLHKKRILWLEKNMKNHLIKSIIIIKHVPPLPVPGLLLCGFTRMNFRKFFLTVVVLNIFGALIFTLLGYYSGLAALSFFKYMELGTYIIPIIIGLIGAVYYLNKWIGNYMLKAAGFTSNEKKKVKL